MRFLPSMRNVLPLIVGWLVIAGPVAGRQTDGLSITATLALRIGALDGPSALGRVEALLVDRAGYIYVLETDEQRVRMFDPEGQIVRALGRRGSGPGELADPVGMAWAPNHTLWIVDPGNARVSVYDTSGKWLADHRLPSAFSLVPWPGRFDRDGNLFHYAPASDDDGFGYVMVKYDAQLTPRDTVFLPNPPERPAIFETRTDRWGVVRTPVPFAPRLVWRLASDGRVWWSWTARYEIYAGADESTATITSSHDGPRVTTRDREAAMEGLQRYREHGGRVEPSRIPDRKPALRTFFLDEQNDVWVMPEHADGDTGRRLDWYDANGRLRGRVELPVTLNHMPTPVVHEGLLYGIERDDLDVPYIIVLRVN